MVRNPANTRKIGAVIKRVAARCDAETAQDRTTTEGK